MFNNILQKLEESNLEQYAYADDLAIVGQTKDKLKQAQDIVETWANENLMKINKKKSGIIFHKFKSKKKRIP